MPEIEPGTAFLLILILVFVIGPILGLTAVIRDVIKSRKRDTEEETEQTK